MGLVPMKAKANIFADGLVHCKLVLVQRIEVA
jgi:hypothetical protein